VRVAGYAALFDRVDRAGDVFRAGAFAGVSEVPLLVGHGGSPVGSVAVVEDARGLRVEGEVTGPVAGLVASGALPGLSVGYRPVEVRQGGYRELRRVALVEVSLVTQPMQPLARVEVVAR
jgi:HK97 family phage prohead protease